MAASKTTHEYTVQEKMRVYLIRLYALDDY